MKGKGLASVGMLAALAVQPASAHHSFAMFDQQKSVELKGTVKEFQWVNPHSWIQLLVGGGKQTEYSIEMGGPSGLVRQGWRKDSIKPGDIVTLTMHPLRSGQPGGSFMSIVLPNGQKLGGDQFRSQPAAAL